MFEIVIAFFLGILFGIFTGLIPGIHINLVASIVLVFSSILLSFFSLAAVFTFLITLGVVHSFTDFIPSLVFGIPNETTAVSLLPNQQMVQSGRAYEALYLNSKGSFYGILVGLLLMMLIFNYFTLIYEIIRPSIGYILIGIIVLMIFLESNLTQRFWAIIIVLFSSFLGIFSLNSLHIQSVFLLLFTGLFGISSLLFSLKEKPFLGKQMITKPNLKIKDILLPLSLSSLSAFFCSVTPGIGSAQAATLVSIFFKNIKTEIQILLLSSINTMNFVFSLMTFYLLSKSRNGIIVALSQLQNQIELSSFLFYLSVILLAGIFSYYVTIFVGKKVLFLYLKLNIVKTSVSLILFLIFLCWYFSGFFGLLIVLYSTILGLLTLELGVKRTHLMSVLLIPVSLHFL